MAVKIKLSVTVTKNVRGDDVDDCCQFRRAWYGTLAVMSDFKGRI